MSACSDAYAISGPFSLFLGVETANWQANDFVKAASFAASHGVTSLFVKVSEVGSKAGSYWYGGIDAFATLKQQIEHSASIQVIPYAFIYGGVQLQQEIAIAKVFLSKFGCYALDIEGSAWAQPDSASWAKSISDVLKPVPGVLFVSCPANPRENNQLPALQAIAPAVNVFMPMVYSNALALFGNEYASISSCVQPTFDLSQEFGTNDPVALSYKIAEQVNSISLWEYQFAVQNPSTLDSISVAFRRQKGMLTPTKEVANFINATQFAGGHDEFACGPFAVSHVKFATAPNVPNMNTQADIQQWGFSEYAKYIGPDTPNDTLGSSVENMHQFYHDAGFQYQDITSINVSSAQSQDIARIKAALKTGYPVIATVREDSVYDVGLQKNPYFWGPSGNHILVYSGIADSGNLLVQDTANIQGALQGANWSQPGPREYDASKLANSYAAIVQTSWLAAIPNNDPLTWQANFNAQEGSMVNAQDTFIVFLWELATPYFKAVGSTLPARDTGIFNSWRDAYLKGNFKGMVLTPEIHTKDKNGNDVIIQAFTGGICQWQNGSASWL
jgi:hypothetical protein